MEKRMEYLLFTRVTVRTHRVPRPILAFALLCAFALVLSIGCSSSAKKLDEASASALIKERLSKQQFKISAAPVSKYLVRSLSDYKTAKLENDEEAVVKELLNKGFVVQRPETLSYPQVSGRFISEGQWGGVWTVYDFQMTPNSNLFTGASFRTNSHDNPVKPEGVWWVQGSIDPTGNMKLNTSGAQEEVMYVEEGGAAFLDFRGGSSYGRYKGKATGKKVDVTSYVYSWNTDFLKDHSTKDANGLFLLGGTFEVGDVSGLRLITETVATASFAWKLSPNDVGKSFFTRIPSGKGEASFGKKPDGTWFVDEIKIDSRPSE
jgi:hypothetical protein